MTTRRIPLGTMVAATLLTVYVLWGSAFAAVKIALPAVPPFLMLGIRCTVAGAVLYAWAVRRAGRAAEPVLPAHWPSAFFVGGTVIVGGLGGTAFAEQFLPSGIVALLVSSSPVWSVLISGVVLRRGISWPTAVGVALGLGGLLLLVHPTGAHGLDVLGATAALAAAMLWAVGSVFAPRVRLPKNALVSAGMQMLAAGAILSVVALATGEVRHVRWTWEAGAAVGYLTVFSSLVGFVAYTWLLTTVPITVSSTVAYIAPVVAVLMGWELLGEPLTHTTLLATAVILAGVALMITSRARSAGQPARPSAEAAERVEDAYSAPREAPIPVWSTAYCDAP